MKQITEFLGWTKDTEYDLRTAINDVVMRNMGRQYGYYLRQVLMESNEFPCPVDGSRTSAILAASDEQLEDALLLLVSDPDGRLI